jgi:hypothetical protein
MMKTGFYLLAALALLAACNKPLLKYNADFEGTWYSETQYNPDLQKFVGDELTFSGKTGTYQVDCGDTCETSLCDCTSKLTGTAEINQQKNLIRLNSQTPRTFAVDTEPYEQGGSWFMKIDGKTYKKQ